MKALQKDTSNSAAESRRERERIREEKEMQRIMGATGNPIPAAPTSAGIKSISLAPKPGFKKISTTNDGAGGGGGGGGGGGWKTIGGPAAKSEAELSWGNDGEDEYDPAYPTPA
jgi:hypothetical protein